MVKHNMKIEEQNKRFERMMGFFAQNYEGEGFPDLAMFQVSLVIF